MICSLAERNVSHVRLDNLLGHVGWTIQHNELPRPSVQQLNLLQELYRFTGIIYALYNLNLKGFIAGI